MNQKLNCVEGGRPAHDSERNLNFEEAINASCKKSLYLKSPFNYIGNKYKLLPQIMPLFPKNINTLVDLFVGGGI